jgi:hypothetical protein
MSLHERPYRKVAKRHFSHLVLQSLLLVITVVPVSASTCRAGAAQVDITPPPGLPMYGYFNRIKNHQLASGTLDPLYARVLVLETGDKRLALVTLDLGRTFREPWLDRLRSAAQKNSRIDYLIVTASHTHSGPNILDENPDEQTAVWQNAALDKIVRGILQATLRLVPARIGVGYGQAYIGYNRRQLRSDGSVTMLWSNPAQIPTEPVDPVVAVLRIDDVNGDPLAILVNYACHPVVLGADNLQYSADYVGVMLKTVAGAFGDKPICFFLQGADGDINPYYAAVPVGQGVIQRLDWTGRQLGMEAVRAAQNIRTLESISPSLDFAEDTIAFPLRWDAQKFHDDLLRVNGPAVFQDHAGLMAATAVPSTLTLRVTTVLINKQSAFVGLPGEPFVDFQIDLRDRCPVRDCMLLGYTNGYFDYFPTILAASQGGYGAGDSDTYVALGAGESMLNHALVRIYEMLGDLKQVPEVPHQSSPVR